MIHLKLPGKSEDSSSNSTLIRSASTLISTNRLSAILALVESSHWD